MTDSRDAKDSGKAAKASGKSKKAAMKASRSAKQAKKQAGGSDTRMPETGPAHSQGRAGRPPGA